ncbi:MAG: AI-2E family transporter [Lachnospiraceae bacterium]|jgi:predicted PurR-regulated permease PerM|nr:AI-2E family transporter [Lachnospiraceae bacterium]
MNKETKKILTALGLISFTAIMFAVAMNFGNVCKWFVGLIVIFTPFLLGIVLALFFNVPMRFFERRLLAGKRFDKVRRTFAILLTLIFVFGIISAVVALIVPQLTKTVSSIVQAVPEAIHNLDLYQAKMAEQFPKYADTINQVNLNSEKILNETMEFLNRWVSHSGSLAMAKVSGTLGSVVNLFIGLIFAIYILAQKEKLKCQTRYLLDAYLKQSVSENIWKVGKLTSITFQKFISGQCLEACILGVLFFIAMSIFRIPYAMMISVLIAVTSLIPIWGAFIGCIVGCFLIAVVNPMQALGFLILFLILQQVEGNLIYPHVVGGSIGLPSIWVLAAVTIGGKLYGIVGMVLFIPISSVLYTLLKENVRWRLARKNKMES